MKADFQFESVVCNLGESRREVLNGREYIVAPATLIVGDSVLNGSDGPGLYPKEDVTADPESWNGMPLVVRHPVDENGDHVSARDPKILNEWGIGNFYRSEADGSNQKGEAWFDVLNVEAVDARLVEQGSLPILPHLESKQPLELSTGLRPNKVQKSGRTLNGTSYTWVAKQPYRPDHVAVFPPGEERGACSVSDGCGVNNMASKQTIWQKLGQMLGLTSNASTLPSGGVQLPDEALNAETICPKCGMEMVDGKCQACGYEMPKDTPVTTNGDSTMPLTKPQRAKMVYHLTTNCSCKTKPEVLNAMDDEQLEAVHNGMTLKLVVNSFKAGKGRFKPTVNAEGEGEAVPGVPWPKLAQLLGIDIDPRQDPVGFTSAMKTALDAISGKLGGEAPMPEPDEDDEPLPGDVPVTTSADLDQDEEEPMTGNHNRRRMFNERDLPAEVREDLAYARNQKHQYKVGLVKRLLANTVLGGRQARGDRLMKLTINELEDRLQDLPTDLIDNVSRVQPKVDWALAGGGAHVVNSEDAGEESHILELMTANCGQGQRATA